MNRQFLIKRIEATEKLIEIYEDAVAALGVGQIQQYSLDTGQGKQIVTRLDLPAVMKTLDSLYNRLSSFQSRLTGSGVVNIRPAF